MESVDLVWFVVGLVLLVAGGELLVRGASRLAVMAGISPLVVGLTVVAFGTSSPELAVSIQASVDGNADIALGNVVGSNIFNVLFILGLSAMIGRLVVQQQLIQRDVPIMIGVGLLLFVLALDERISRLDGAVLAAGIAVYTLALIWLSRRETAAVRAEYDEAFGADEPPAAGLRGALPAVAQTLVGLGLLVFGANWLVESAVNVASALGVSSLIIGLTIIAAGTSLPEVVTSLIAAFRGERDIAVGNVVGSNIFNILAVLGITSIVSGSGVAVAGAALRFDIPVMLAVMIACLPIFFTRHAIERWEGALFFAYYLAYTLYLILDATGHDALGTYRAAMVFFVIPLTVLTFGVVLARSIRQRRAVS
jgi:cation:H+ antiporter